MPGQPDCYQCKHRTALSGNSHSGCANRAANVTANPHGVRNGWFLWPWNFDPLWLRTCDGFAEKATLEPTEAR